MFSAPLVEASGAFTSAKAPCCTRSRATAAAPGSTTRIIQGVSPAGLATDGTVYVQMSYGPVQALGRDGTHRWTLPITAYVSGLVVRDDGTLLFAALGERQFGAVDAAGAVQWQKPGSFAGFAIGGDGAPYAADGAGILRLDRDGSTVWQALAGGHGAIVEGRHGLQRVSRRHRGGGRERHRDVGVFDRRPGRPRIGRGGARVVRGWRRRNAVRRNQRPRPRDGGGGRCEGEAIDCDDGDPCTVDRCSAQAGCVHTPKCVSPGACTAARCAADGACSFTPRVDGVPCSDGVTCSDGDACHAGQCRAASSSCGSAGAWPSLAHDAAHTRATTLLGPTSGAVKWGLPGPRASAFGIAGDGTIYATDGHQMSTIDAGGAAAPLAAVPARDVVLRENGGLYATTSSTLQALGAAGETQWTFDAAFVSPPAVGPSGAIYLMADRDLVALAPDGTTLWRIPTGGGYASPIVGPDGTIYALCPDLWSIAPDGRVKWKRAIGWASGLVVGPTGTVYAVVGGGVRAIDSNGADAWMWSLGVSAVLAPPALSPRGDLILVAGTTIYRLDASTGALRSTLTPPAPARTAQPLTPPIADGDGVLYVIGNATDTKASSR